ncbi:MAG: OmpA family protein [Motiliproteus sp.]
MKKVLLVSAVVSLSMAPLQLWAHGSCDDDQDHCAYWHDSSGTYTTDSSDKCIRTGSWFEEAQVEGCSAMMAPMDADGDGVVDGSDSCPQTPAGAAVDMKGCELDSDVDGVVDSLDSCPETAPGVAVDEKGCALDSDGDGVLNTVDQCPDTPQGQAVDETGCEPAVTPTSVELEVTFAPNSSDIGNNYDADQMQKLTDYLQANPQTKVEIAGHTSRDVGKEGYNQKLSEQRAAAVVDLLVGKYGASAAQLKPVGYGQSQPVADNDSKAGRAQNRRVEASVAN